MTTSIRIRRRSGWSREPRPRRLLPAIRVPPRPTSHHGPPHSGAAGCYRCRICPTGPALHDGGAEEAAATSRQPAEERQVPGVNELVSVSSGLRCHCSCQHPDDLGSGWSSVTPAVSPWMLTWLDRSASPVNAPSPGIFAGGSYENRGWGRLGRGRNWSPVGGGRSACGDAAVRLRAHPMVDPCPSFNRSGASSARSPRQPQPATRSGTLPEWSFVSKSPPWSQIGGSLTLRRRRDPSRPRYPAPAWS